MTDTEVEAPARTAARSDSTSDQVGDVAGNMLATLVGNFFPPIATLVTAPILAHGLGVVDRGAVAAATAPLLLVTTAATFGIPQAATYAIARSPGSLRRATRMAMILMLAASIVATTSAILAARWLSGGNASTAHLIVVASLAITPSLLVAVLRGAASGLHLWRMVTIERLLSAVARLVIIVPLWLTGHLTPFTATLVISVGPLIGAIAYLSLASIHPVGEDTAVDATPRRLIGYGLRTWVGAVSGILLSRLDQTVMTPLSSEYQLGLYAVGSTIADIPLIINSAVRDVTFSADAAQTTNRRLGASARISSTASAALGLFTAVTMIWWLPLLFGSEFRAAIPCTALLIAAIVLGTPGSIAGAGLAARGRPGLRSTSLILSCVINVVALFLLVPRYGALGGAICTLIGCIISSNANIFFLKRLFGVPVREFYGFRREDWHTVVRFSVRMYRSLRP